MPVRRRFAAFGNVERPLRSADNLRMGTPYPQVWAGHEVPQAPPPEPPPRWKRWRGAAWRGTRTGTRASGGVLANWWKNGSTNTRIALAAAAALALIFAIHSAVTAIWPAPSYVRIICAHPFRAAQIIVWIDEKEVANDVMMSSTVADEAQPRRHSSLLRRADSTWLATLPLARGPHNVRVRVASTEEPFDRTRSVEAELAPGRTTPVEIACNRGTMLAFAAPPQDPNARPDWSFSVWRSAWFAHYSSPAMLGLAALAIACAVVLLMRGRAPQLAFRKAA
jgi:hypothetical protein